MTRLALTIVLVASAAFTTGAPPATAPARSAASSPRPATLTMLETSRAARWTRAKIDWTFTSFTGPRKVIHYTSQIRPRERIITDRGDDRGVIMTNTDGEPVIGVLHSWRRENGDTWETDGRSLSVNVLPSGCNGRPIPFSDVCAIDLAVSGKPPTDVHNALWRCGFESLGDIRYAETTTDGLAVITIQFGPNGNRSAERKLWIDPARGMTVVKSEVRENGRLMFRTKVTPRQYNGVWFFGRVEWFHTGFHDGKEPMTVITIDSAEFSDKLRPAFAPEDVGVEVGTNMTIYPTAAQPPEIMVWNGSKPVTSAEIRQLLAEGKVKRGPNFEREIRAPVKPPVSGETALIRATLDRWDQLVTDFAKEHDLTAPQRIAANAILKDCKTAVDRHVAAHRKEFEDYNQKVAAQNDPMSSKTPESISEMFAARRVLSAPIEKIEHAQLMPRLQAILEKSQKARR